MHVNVHAVRDCASSYFSSSGNISGLQRDGVVRLLGRKRNPIFNDAKIVPKSHFPSLNDLLSSGDDKVSKIKLYCPFCTSY